MGIGINSNFTSGDAASQSTGSTITLTKPTGTSNTDILIFCLALDSVTSSTFTINAPSGWTSITTAIRQANGSSNVILYGFWALGSVTNLGFTVAGGSGSCDTPWVLVGFTGVDNTTPIDAVGTTHSSTGATTDTAQAVTVATANAWEVILTSDFNDNTPSATGFTAKVNANVNASACVMYNTTPKSIGSTGTTTVTWSSTATGEIICTMPFALRPLGTALPNDDGLICFNRLAA